MFAFVCMPAILQNILQTPKKFSKHDQKIFQTQKFFETRTRKRKNFRTRHDSVWNNFVHTNVDGHWQMDVSICGYHYWLAPSKVSRQLLELAEARIF